MEVTEKSAAGIILAESSDLIQTRASFFDALHDADRERLLSIGRKVTFEPNQPVWQQGDPHRGIYFIDEGRIRTFYLAPSGRELSLAYWFPGNFVGGPDMFGEGVHMWSSSAVQKTVATFLPGKQLRQLAGVHASIAVALLDALAFKARCYSAMVQMMGTRSSSERLHRLITFLASTYGFKDDDGILVGVSLTHAELAGLIGSTRQWVTTQLARLQKQGVLRHNRGILLVTDLEALTAAKLD
jgi:CRP/FNR family transcriptional regulator, cyclic AMP receptor protein